MNKKELQAIAQAAAKNIKTSAMKMVYLAVQQASKKWTMPIRNWKPALNRFMIEFEERLAGYI